MVAAFSGVISGVGQGMFTYVIFPRNNNFTSKEQLTTVEDNVVERLSDYEVEEVRERLNQDKEVRQHQLEEGC